MKRSAELRRATPLNRSGELKRTGRLPFRSKRRAREEREYLAERDAHLAEHPWCLVCVVELETELTRAGDLLIEPATEIHHKRGRIGKLLLDKRFWLPVCNVHHRKITENPAWAIEHGWSDSRLAVRS